MNHTSLHEYLDRAPDTIILSVGAEGGFQGEEVAYFEKEGFSPLNLGSRVLRVETASLYVVAAVQTILQEREKWKLM